MHTNWDDRVEKYDQSARLGSDSSNTSAGLALEKNYELSFECNPEIWMPVSWHIRGGVVILPCT
ncbi:hypothetical protein GYMLUDRAFT_43381 [Collybiopsis luxurians FD-317 M1]|uniref:Uncharacterized protein n=1 Tax=Collybiopsis luxurians FD-317 M1 TaxID=944289 RepID=A0A0D0CX59_9AGAR|nr:hypothetical protein GYMLUDRAFT_43381 [Collybiopsis luxurians FD-317 M1]